MASPALRGRPARTATPGRTRSAGWWRRRGFEAAGETTHSVEQRRGIRDPPGPGIRLRNLGPRVRRSPTHESPGERDETTDDGAVGDERGEADDRRPPPTAEHQEPGRLDQWCPVSGAERAAHACVDDQEQELTSAVAEDKPCRAAKTAPSSCSVAKTLDESSSGRRRSSRRARPCVRRQPLRHRG